MSEEDGDILNLWVFCGTPPSCLKVRVGGGTWWGVLGLREGQFSKVKYKLQKNSISKFPQPGVDEAMNCAMHLVKVQGER